MDTDARIQVATPTEENGGPRAARAFCAMRPMPERPIPPDLTPDRERALIATRNVWLNGTVIHYYFFDRDGEGGDGEYVRFTDGSRRWRTWVGPEAQKEAVRRAFGEWKDLGIGLEFQEVASRDEAEVRIGFMPGDGSWSYLGTRVLEFGPGERTMNFGWDLRTADGYDTALHEIGHTLSLCHEHQNENAGIEWDEDAVYAELAREPNRWDRKKTHYNILRKLGPDEARGSVWDPDSIMHYPFGPGLIRNPAQFRNGVNPRGGLSEMDIAWIRATYPPLGANLPELRPGRSEPLAVPNGGQCDFAVTPSATRKYQIRTFGSCDSLIALFEDEGGNLRYQTADDDSGEDRNASLAVKLLAGRRYVLRVRMKYSDASTPPTIMMW